MSGHGGHRYEITERGRQALGQPPRPTIPGMVEMLCRKIEHQSGRVRVAIAERDYQAAYMHAREIEGLAVALRVAVRDGN